MAVGLQDISLGTGDHAVAFYERESDLVRTVGQYVTTAVQSDEVAIVIATEAHLQAFEACVEDAGVDLSEARRDGTLVSLDASGMLATLAVEGHIDNEAFAAVVGSVIRKALGSRRVVRAYGEMVALLWDAGDVLTAIELETAWNDLAQELPFSLLCAYPDESVSGSDQSEALQRVCDLHSSVHHRPHALDSAATEVRGTFPAKPDSVGAARRMVTDGLQQLGHGNPVIAEAAFVVTELVTNAIVHARSPVSVTARVENALLRISVQDADPTIPTMRTASLIAESGRGLQLVAALSSSWGVEVKSGGKEVWAELQTSRSS